MIRDIATQHPEKLSDALSSLNDYQTLVKEKSLGGHSLDPTLTYFLALIAFACLSGVYLSIHTTVPNPGALPYPGTSYQPWA